MGENGIVWEEPPVDAYESVRGRWLVLLAPLREHPGRWARIDERPTRGRASVEAGNRRRQARVSWPDEIWEFTSRGVENGAGERYYVYARYIGPKEAAK